MKTLIAVVVSIYWIFFFTAEQGFYPLHIFELFTALGLTLLVAYLDYKVSCKVNVISPPHTQKCVKGGGESG